MDKLRVLPANFEAEQLLIGSILVNNHILNQFSDFLLPIHFSEEIHQKIYQAILNIIDRGMSVSLVTMIGAMHNDTIFAEIGGREYLVRLMTMSVGVINSYEYAKIIYDLYLKRDLINIGTELVNATYDATIEDDAQKLIENVESRLFNLATFGNSDKSFTHLGESISGSITRINNIMKNPSHVTGISTGLTDLNRKLFGFHDSDLLILAGRPSMGKTSFALNLAMNAALDLKKNHKEGPLPSVGFFSLEMSSEQLSTRLLSMYSEIDLTMLRSGYIDSSDYSKLRKKAEELSSIPIFIDDTGALTISAIRTRARRLKRKNNMSILFIDYLQLINTVSKRDNRSVEVSEITQALKALAKELNIPIIALSQLSRAVESRDDKRPMLSDLRESGAIEQDSDIVMFIYREEYYLSRKQPERGSKKYEEWLAQMDKANNLAEIIMAKHRHGPIATVRLYYDAQHSKFSDLLDARANEYEHH